MSPHSSNSSPQFENLALIAPLLAQLKTLGYETPTPIQAQSIPAVLEGRDVLGCAQTGTGKTAAFALPILQRLSAKPPAQHRAIRALVLAPTRELALQIQRSFSLYGKRLALRSFVIFGGVGQEPQVRALRQGVDILVATPGRLVDLMNQRLVNLNQVEVLVLDEADRMLDMGFIPDIRKILKVLPAVRQNLLFSATMPQEIQHLVDQILRNPVHVKVTPVSSTAEKIEQSVFFVQKADKKSLLAHVLDRDQIQRALVFTRTKHDANRVAMFLEKHRIMSEAIHGNKSQSARQKALEGFRRGSVRVLVATDIASRGIDVSDVTHVINMDVPDAPENYVHRIGRTGRAGNAGTAFCFCSPEERRNLGDIERLIKKRLRVVPNHPYSGPQR